MLQERISPETLSEFLRYLATQRGDYERIPTLAGLSKDLGVSIASLREQLEVARVLGLVEVKPRTGIRRLPYTFLPAVRQSLSYAVTVDDAAFEAFSDLRTKVESAYWFQAVSLLTGDDRVELMHLVQQAELKIHAKPPQAAHTEHRELHLLIYRRLANPFVLGILEGYWELYESFGLNMVMDVDYLENVWRYHRKMVEAIQRGDYDSGFEVLVEHMQLIIQRQKPSGRQRFE